MILYSKVLFGYSILGGRADVSSSCSWKTVPSLPSFYGEGSSCYGQQWRGYCKVKKFVGQLHCFQAIARWSHTIQKAPLTATPGEHNNHPSPVLQQPVHHHRTCGLSVFIVSSWKFWILATARLLNQAGKWNLWRSPGHSRAHPDHNPFSLGSHLETSQNLVNEVSLHIFFGIIHSKILDISIGLSCSLLVPASGSSQKNIIPHPQPPFPPTPNPQLHSSVLSVKTCWRNCAALLSHCAQPAEAVLPARRGAAPGPGPGEASWGKAWVVFHILLDVLSLYFLHISMDIAVSNR